MTKKQSITENAITTVTEKGQVTIPNGIRKALGIRPKDKIRFSIADGEVRLTPVSMTLEAAFGAVPPISRPEDFKKRVREAKRARATKRATRRTNK